MFEEDRRAAIAALDAAVKIVPLIDPADGSVGALNFVERGDAFAAGDFAEQRKHPVEDTTIVRGANDYGLRAPAADRLQPECLSLPGFRRPQVLGGGGRVL